MDVLKVDGHTLTTDQVIEVARLGTRVCLEEEARERVTAGRRAVEDLLARGEVVYGVTTGFGKFADIAISPDRGRQLQVNLLRSHAVGTGELLPGDVVRAAVLLRANALARGCSGVRPELIDALLDLLNHRIHPAIPSQGSLGASGDLAPLAHMALVLIGEGQVLDDGRPAPSGPALEAAGLRPLVLEPKEGLALINGTQIMTALGLLSVHAAGLLARQADIAAALTAECLRAMPSFLDPDLHGARPHPGQIEVAGAMRRLLVGSGLLTEPGQFRVQDAYSIRCVPQVHGACRDVIAFARSVLEREINAATDNPLIFPSPDGHHRVVSGGNFHGQPLAMALDALAVAVAELASISERRLDRLVNPGLNEGLPPFLTARGGLESGMMILHYTAAALVSENKVLCHPASVDSIPTSGGQEDHVSMGAISARKALAVVSNSTRVLGAEFMAACQAADYRGTHLLAPATALAYRRLRMEVSTLDEDRSLAADVERAADLVADGHILAAVDADN